MRSLLVLPEGIHYCRIFRLLTDALLYLDSVETGHLFGIPDFRFRFIFVGQLQHIGIG